MHYVPVVVVRNAVRQWTVILLILIVNYMFVVIIPCDGYEVEEGEFRLKGYEGPVIECDKCGAEMHLKWVVLASTWVAPMKSVKYT